MTIKHDTSLYSHHLHRAVVLDVVLPPNYKHSEQPYKVLYMNDGQDLERLHFVKVLDKLLHTTQFEPFIVVAIHCGERLQEYGVAAQADYKKRGAKAGAYTSFVLEELMPHIQKNFRVLTGSENTVFSGFSLGGLSAFDMVWHHPDKFGKVGSFSGSFWWRQKAYENHYDDENDRIMHRIVRQSAVSNRQSAVSDQHLAVSNQHSAISNQHSAFSNQQSAFGSQYSALSTRHSSLVTRHSLKFWFQTGTEDEKDDRNNNGVIDSIEDTLDLIAELEKKGFRWGQNIRYVEVKGGTHDPDTWSDIMPDFLTWAFGKK